MNPSEEDEDLKRADAALDLLREHFDSVRIFCTRYDGEEGTTVLTRASGNYFAQVGQIREWMIRVDEDRRMKTRQEGDTSQG